MRYSAVPPQIYNFGHAGGAMLGVPLLDPVAALFVAGMIVKAGLETGYQRYTAHSPSRLGEICRCL